MPTMFIYECENARDLLSQCETLSVAANDDRWVFRGQSDAAWDLLPSLFRSKLPADRHEEFERTIIANLRERFRTHTTHSDRILDDDNFLLAFARHSGVETRLLDWSVDPDVALYFAASVAAREVPASGNTAVFAMRYRHLPAPPTDFVFPVPAANPNLAAQRGLLVRHDWDKRSPWDAGQAERHSWQTADRWRNARDAMTAAASTGTRPLIRFDLAVSDLRAAMALLEARHVDASTLFPGERGHALHGRDIAWRVFGLFLPPHFTPP